MNGGGQKAAGGDREPLNVLIAGGGIGGLLLAAGLLKRGFKVTVLERDLTAIRGEGKYRGPIQVCRWRGGGRAVACVGGGTHGRLLWGGKDGAAAAAMERPVKGATL